jgi:tetratricopeptide (TPR) repeat protein
MATHPMTETGLAKFSDEVKSLLLEGRSADAGAACDRLRSEHPTSAGAQLLASRVYQQLGLFDRMLETASRASGLAPTDVASQLQVVEGLIYCAQINVALNRLSSIEKHAASDHRLMQAVAEMYLHCQSHADARRCYQRAVDLQPGNSDYLFNLAAQCVALGEIDRAEALFSQAIELRPGDFGAYQNRSMLKTWGVDNNHVSQLSRLLERVPPGHPGEIPLCYALAKEYEDLGESVQSFALLQRGAQARRNKLAYKVKTDVDAMARIRQVFDGHHAPGRTVTARAVESIFVLGLPRSGTTLVDRILGSHSQVDSLGEINDFAFALIRLANGSVGKLELIDRSAHLDFERLGDLYTEGLASYGRHATWLTNKMPQNYLYIALIRLALPDSRIVHLRRHPLDSCYAMYKTLFRMGYPFSYSLEDLGHYYLAYHQLMAHWRETIPDAFIDIDYESLVHHQEETSRNLVEYCGLAWEPACLEFHKNDAPAATASAAQVRRKVYNTSVNRWREFEAQLQPLAEFLSANGIDCA